MCKRFSQLLFCFMLILGASQPLEKGFAAGGTITIIEETVNVRNGPGLSYQLVKKVKNGEKYTIIKEQDNWIEIQLSNGETGWVANWVVTKNSDSASKPAKGSMKASAVATEDQLRVRSGPGTSFRIIGLLGKGQAFTVLAENENWLKVQTDFGEGWVTREYVLLENSQDSTKKETKETTTGIVNELLNVRNQPSTSSTIVGKLSKGQTITIYSKKGNWLEIQFANQKAWISADYVQIGGTNVKTDKPPSGITGVVTASSLNVRSNYSLNSSIVGKITKGQRFSIIEEDNNWIKIEYQPGKFGWAASWYFNKDQSNANLSSKDSKITILHNGTNIRKSPTVESEVLHRANEGETYSVNKVENNWYEITLGNGSSGFVAGWIVSTNGSGPIIEKQGVESYLKYKTIVIDPGHGGIDNGATGTNGTHEKELTLRTAQLLYDKLKSAGANVILTRSNDSYLPLPSRVRTAGVHQADAFISLHYDSNLDRSIRGMTGYYYHSYQKELADYLYHSTNEHTRLKSRGVRQGDYHVIRENNHKSVLMELGYISNPEEALTLNSSQFQENAATGLYNGLARFFKDN
ncbi:MAG: N-acetylmuramoyl-L-alanine amidase [Neobacillus sp.]|nr:N-acetylmuramoyl-L-alanine amidase [Neobacillus sp.]